MWGGKVLHTHPPTARAPVQVARAEKERLLSPASPCWSLPAPQQVCKSLCSLSSYCWEKGGILSLLLPGEEALATGTTLDSAGRSAGRMPNRLWDPPSPQSTHPEPVCPLPTWFRNAFPHGPLLVLAGGRAALSLYIWR